MNNFIPDYDLIVECMNKYLDSMPPRSKVIFPDLIDSVKDMLKIYAPMNVRNEHISFVAKEVVHARTDLVVKRGIGIYKHKW
jgi:hypothetical protein